MSAAQRLPTSPPNDSAGTDTATEAKQCTAAQLAVAWVAAQDEDFVRWSALAPASGWARSSTPRSRPVMCGDATVVSEAGVKVAVGDVGVERIDGF
ncbi:hypothetical protein GCM10010383_54970 [Streptomyces lomondensis]|uniref:Uncharacterized protein n=1 Tax=Streptomyces lomondensis TaxID=68229 RepID=A0ABQ2XJQ3_9ACTN|nr:hypothetical protein GCM10010383_54970 [Streptomyces lomondensis]